MGSALGLRTAIGTGVETVYGTPVAIDRRYEFLSESLARANTVLQSQGISGRAVTMRRGGASRVLSARMGSGDITMEVSKTKFGRWFNQMLGGTSTIAQQGGTPAYLQTHTFGDLLNKSQTVQKVLRDGAGTVIEDFTYHGCKVTNWELSISVDQILQLQVGLDAEDVDTSTSSATLVGLAEPTPDLFSFKEGSLSIAGTPVAKVLAATISGDNALRTDGFYIGSLGLKTQPEVNDFRSVTGSLRADFTDPALFYNRFATDAPIALELDFVGDVISGAHSEQLTISIPEVHFTGETPQVGGPGIIEENIPFEAAWDGTNSPIVIEYMSTDTSI